MLFIIHFTGRWTTESEEGERGREGSKDKLKTVITILVPIGVLNVYHFNVFIVCVCFFTAVIQYRCRELFGGKLHRRLPVAQNSLVDPIDTFKLLATRRFRA